MTRAEAALAVDGSCRSRDSTAPAQGAQSLNALTAEAFNDLLKKHGKRAAVENPLLLD
jgi:hypothetical protein